MPGAELLGRVEQYLDLLARWNEKINLTAFQLREPTDEAIDRLIIEPLVAARHLPSSAFRLIDIGSGSGSPAIPICLACPEAIATLVEAKTRKSVFLREAQRHLGLDGVSVETARFEQLLTWPELHEAFDVLTIRAVRVESARLRTLQAFVRPGGDLYWFRGPSGPDAPGNLIPPLTWHGTFALVENLRSRLVVLRKQR